MKYPRRHALVGVAASLLAGTLSTRALAQSEPETIDTALGAIAGGTRLIGLGGAFVAIAEDTAGVATNPASVALRLPFSWRAWDYAAGVHVSIGTWLPKNDIFNESGTGGITESSALFGSLAAILYYQHAGFGVSAEAQSNAATRRDRAQGIAPAALTANFGIVHASLAYGFLDGQLLLGAGPRLAGMSFDKSSTERGPFTAAGAGYETGVIIKPIASQYRIGAAARSPISAALPAGSEPGPSTVSLPWEVSLGFAYQFGPRPLNPPFVTARELARQTTPGHEPTSDEVQRAEDELFERYQRRPRQYLLVSTELAVIEGGGGRVGIEQYWTNSGEGSSPPPVFSPRLGVESEVVPHILKLRAGSYLEPARAVGAQSRLHGTGGLDVRLFEWGVFGLVEPFDYWQFSLGVDAARSYLNTSFSLGFWY